MKRSILRALALCLTTICAGLAWAQDDSKSSGTPAPQGTAGASTSTFQPGTASSYSSRLGQPVRLSKLMTTSLKGQSGDSLGLVQDVLIDPTSGQAQFVVISLSSSSAGAPGTSASTAIGTS